MKFEFTNIGNAVLSEIISSKKIVFTKVEVGDKYSASPKNLLSVQDVKQHLQLTDIVYDNVKGKTKLVITLSNLSVSTAYQLRQMGIYAKINNGEEKLIIVGQSQDGEEVPAITEREVEYDYTVWLLFDNTYEISLSISENDFVKRKRFEDTVALITDRYNKLSKVVEVTIPATGWTNTAPFIQTINVDGIRETDSPVVSMDTSIDTATHEKAYNCITRVETFDGNVKVTCRKKKPQGDIKLLLKGV